MNHLEQGEYGSTRNHFAICVSILLLALAVFGWGLHSKLSLYRLRASETTPTAKLLSERERPPAPAQHCRADDSEALRAIASCVTLLALPASDECLRIQRSGEDAPPLVSRSATFKGPSLRRPPPSLFI